MANGAWDYPANVRGYTYGAVAQVVWKNYAIRAAITAVPMEANGTELQFKGKDAMGSVIEFEMNHFNFSKQEETKKHIIIRCILVFTATMQEWAIIKHQLIIILFLTLQTAEYMAEKEWLLYQFRKPQRQSASFYKT